MSSALASAVARCAWRRARPLLAANPLVAGLTALLVATTPALGVLAGRRLGAALGPEVAREEQVASALVLGVALAATAAGALAALGAPGAAFLGSQLRAAPVAPLRTFLSLTLAPLGAAAVAALLVLGCVLVPVAAAAPGGTVAAAPVLLAGLAAGALGAAAGESVLGSARGSAAGAVSAAAVAGVGALAVLAGPLEQAAAALRGGDVAGPAVETVLVVAAAVGLWALAAVRRPEEPPAPARVRVVVPVRGGPCVASAIVAAKLLSRRRELRRAVAATGGAAVAGAAALAHGLGGPEAGFTLAAGAALLGCAAVPAAAYGVDREGAWLADASPAPGARRAAAAALGALALALALLTLSLGAVWLAAPAPWRQAAALLGAGCVLFGAALAAGTLFPWRRDGVVDQLAAFAALGALVLALWLALGELVRRSTDAGVPGPAVTGVALVLPALLGVGASVWAARRRAR